ncbi:fibronectin type III domain-containing protein [Aureispira]|nr:fibronectin type III domain-containing protein [Aureispira sp.]
MSLSVYASTDKYRCILRDNPATSIVIAWNQISGNSPIVYYDITDHGPDSTAYSFSHGVDRSIIAKGMNNNFSRLTGLSPNTVYYFIIVDDNSISHRFSFKTAPDVPTERLSFIAGGDSRNNRVPRVNANKLVAKTRTNAVIFGGDMTDTDIDWQWQDWFDDWQFTIANDGRITPIVVARGNHEYNNASIHDLFDTPSIDIYYALTFGGNLYRTYILNSNIAVNGNQKNWLENDLLSSSHIQWKSAHYHHAMLPHVSYKNENINLINNWAPLFEQYGLDFAVECDIHAVKNTYPIHTSNLNGSQEGFIRDDQNGVVYIGEGCWGAPLRAIDDDKSWTRHSGSFNQVKWIFIDQNKIEIRTIKIDNADLVGDLNDNNRFSMPTNIDIWTPALYEDVLTIHNTNSIQEITLVNPIDRQLYMNIHPINLRTVASDSNFSVVKIHFMANGNLIGVDSIPPYVHTWTPPITGKHTIRATAYGINNQIVHSNVSHIDVYSAPSTLTLYSKVNSTSDDAEENDNGSMNVYSQDLQMTFDLNSQTIGLRFNRINIPGGAHINNAYIQFTSTADNNKQTDLTIDIQDAVDATTFGFGINNISSRPLSNNSVLWSPPGWLNGESTINQQTPDLASMVQSVINKKEWRSGNSLAFIIGGTGRRTAATFDASALNAPTIYINYTINPPPITKPVVSDVSFCLGSSFTLVGTAGYHSYFWQNNIEDNQNNLFTVHSGGNYIMRVMDSFGQVSGDTSLVSAYPTPAIDLGPDVYLNGGYVTLSIPQSYSNYFWNTGETTASITTTQTGTYTLIVIDSNGCLGIDVINVYSTIGANSIINNNNSLHFYPNPVGKKLYFKIDILPNLYPIRIEIFDYSGKRKYVNTYTNFQFDIDVSFIPSGLYYIRMIDVTDKTISRPFVVQK